MATTKSKPRKVKTTKASTTKKRRVLAGNAASQRDSNERSDANVAQPKPDTGSVASYLGIIVVSRQVAPAEQDRPDDFYLGFYPGGLWSVCCVPKAGEASWEPLDTAQNAEAIFGVWKSFRLARWTDTKLRMQTEGTEGHHEVVALSAPDDERKIVVVDPDGRIVPDVYRTFQLASLTKKWTVELHTGAIKTCLHEGTFRRCDEVYNRESKKKSAGTLIFLTPLGEVYKQQARVQFRKVLDVDKLEVDEKAPEVYNKIVSEKPDRITKVRDRLARWIRKMAAKVAP